MGTRHHLEDRPEGPVLALGGGCTVESATTLVEAFRQILDRHDSLTLDLSAVERADLTFIQLLCSAERTCRARGGAMAVRGDLPGAVLEAAGRLGLSLDFLTTGGDA